MVKVRKVDGGEFFLVYGSKEQFSNEKSAREAEQKKRAPQKPEVAQLAQPKRQAASR